MKKALMICILLLSMLVISVFARTTEAIVNGTLDGNNHPYVCLVVFDVETDGVTEPAWRTTGILLSPTVVLTAGHGTDGAVAARVWLDSGPIASINDNPPGEYSYGGILHTRELHIRCLVSVTASLILDYLDGLSTMLA